MTAPLTPPFLPLLPLPAPHRPEKAITLALRLAHAENALQAFTSGQVDAIVDADGHAYLLRPAQEHLRQSERRLRDVIASAADVITVVGRGGAILSQSPAIGQVLGYEPEKLVGSRIFEFIHDDDLARTYSAFFNVIEGFEANATTCFRHRASDGSYRMLEATVAKLGDESRESVVFSMRPMGSPPRSFIDFVEPFTQEVPPAPIIPPTPAKDRFLAMLSHELRTPLTPVLLGVNELEADERFAEALPTLKMIRRNVELQLRLLEELIDFTTIGEHKVRLRLEPLDVHEVIRFVLEICRSEIAAAQIRVRLDLGAPESLVLADSVRLQQVMWNLIKNAIKFSPTGSSIDITTTGDSAGKVTIEFSDRGIGIEPALLPLIFDAFQQGEAKGQHRNGGLGLGLFIAKGLAEAQGGTLSVHSGGRGKGATFRLVLVKVSANEAVPPTEIDAGFFHPVSHSIPV